MDRIPRPLSTVTVLALAAGLLATTTVTTVAVAGGLPTAVGGKTKVLAKIEPVGDVDEFSFSLLAGDSVKIKAKDAGPDRGVFMTLTIFDETGADVTPFVKKQGGARPQLVFDAGATATYTLRVEGDPGGLAGADGNYSLSFKVKRAKQVPVHVQDDQAGTFTQRFLGTPAAVVKITAKVKKETVQLDGLLRPDDTPEPAFDQAVVVKGKSAKVKAYPLSGGLGTYELQGRFAPGTKLKVKVKVKHDDAKRTLALDDLEPVFDPFFDPFPAAGIAGTRVNVTGVNFSFDPGQVDNDGRNVTTDDDTHPTFSVGGLPADPDTVTMFGSTFQFAVPPGLAVGESHDVTVVNFDGQGAVFEDAFFMVPLMTVTSVLPSDAGPAGGRFIQITGSDIRSSTVILFGETVVQPERVLPNRIDVIAPPHAPGTVDLTLRDDFGRTVVLPNAVSYLDRGSNEVTSVDLTFLHGLGGETVTVTGVDFAADSVLTLGGNVLDATLVSPTTMTFTAPPHPGGMFELRVTDSVEQSTAVQVEVRTLTDDTDALVPDPRTTADEVDGWRASRILSGRIDDDLVEDLILLRPEAAFGSSVDRPRVRLLLGNADGTFTDGTDTNIPDVLLIDDWRADGGVLFDYDDDDDLDLAIITTAELDSGNRSSLRLFENDGDGVFTDVTAAGIPVPTAYGDRNQGVSVTAADVDGKDGPDLIFVHTESFLEEVDTSPPPPPPPAEPPPPIIEQFFYPGTRVFLNDGDGIFARTAFRVDLAFQNVLPENDDTDAHIFEGDTLVAGDVDGDNDVDLFLTRDNPTPDPDNAGTFLLTCVFLENDGTGTFTDESATALPAASDPEYLQGDRLVLADLGGGGDLDLFVLSDLRLASPVDQTVATTPATRIFENDGNGVFTDVTGDLFPARDLLDSYQASGMALGDLTGDGLDDLVLISSLSPNTSGRALRILVQDLSGFFRTDEGLPSPLGADDLRGLDVLLLDVDGSGSLDVVFGRSEADETVRNTRILLNPR